MNKQNKKIAQEKRRVEREKAQKKAKVVNLLKFWVPVRKLHHRPQNLRHQRHKAVIHRQRQQHLIQRLTRLRKTEIR